MTVKIWQDCCTKLCRELENEDCEAALRAGDFESFQASIDSLCKEYTRKNVTKLVREKLSPHFEHVRSFEKAIASSAQIHPAATGIWSGSQFVLELAVRFSDHLDTTLDQLADLYKSLPIFEQYLELFPDNKRLEYPLRDLYNDYGKFCVLTVRYIKRKPTSNMLKNIITSRSRQELKAVMNAIQVHKDDFEKETELAFRQYSMRASVADASQSGSSSLAALNTQHIVSLRRNPAFLGRDAVLKELHTDLGAEKSSTHAEPVSCLLRGMGGIGKTQTALEYTYRYRTQYDHVFWLAAERPLELGHAYVQIATKIACLELGSTAEISDNSQNARSWLETTGTTFPFMFGADSLTLAEKKWLLVFDNVESWQDISPFWPNTCRNKSAIIVTSQKMELSSWTTTELPLKSLKLDTGSQLLLRYLQRDHTADDKEKEYAMAIVDMFGCLPLAIAHIGGYISESKCTLKDFKEMAKQRYSFIWEGDAPATLYQYDKRLDLVWDFALEELPPDAKTLIYTMAFMHPDYMSEDMLISQFEVEVSGPCPQTARKARFIDMTRKLVRRHLVNRESDGGVWYFTVHRALQRGVLYKLDKDPFLRRATFHRALSVIRQITPEASPIQVPTPDNWERFEAALPQITALRAAVLQSQPPIEGTLEFAKILYDAGFNTWEREMSHQGLELLHTAQEILDAIGHKAESKLRADIHTMIALLCDNIGITMRAEGFMHGQKSLSIRKSLASQQEGKMSRVDDILLHNAMNDLAESYLQNYDYERAKALVDICKAKYEEWGTEKDYPFEYSKYYRNTGTVMALQGHFEEAIKCGSRAAELSEMASGIITPRYLYYYYDVACQTFQSGNVEEALKMHKEIWETREEICGSHHDVTLQSCYAVGAMYFHLGNLPEATKWIRMSLDRASQAHWPEEPLSRAQFHLAKILRAQDSDLAEAAELEKQAREVLQKLLVHDHPKFLHGVDDELTLFDHMQPIFRGRFTGRNLTCCVKKRASLEAPIESRGGEEHSHDELLESMAAL